MKLPWRPGMLVVAGDEVMRITLPDQYVGPDCKPVYEDPCTRGGLVDILQEKEPHTCLIPVASGWALYPQKLVAATQAEVLRIAFEEVINEQRGDEEEGPGPGPSVA